MEDDWRTGEEVDAAAPAEEEKPAVVCTYGGNRVSAVMNSNEASADFLAGPATLHTARTCHNDVQVHTLLLWTVEL